MFISYFYDGNILFFSYKGVIILPVRSYYALKTHDKLTKESQWNIANIHFHYQFWKGEKKRKLLKI